MKLKMTFGIQNEMIQRIENVSAHWDSIRTDDKLIDGWIKYDRYFWEKLGEEFGWDPFTLALHYFRIIEKRKQLGL